MADNTTRPYLIITHPEKDGAYGLYDDNVYLRFKAYGINISEVNNCKIELKNIQFYVREKGTSSWTLVKSGDVYSPPTLTKWDAEIYKDEYSRSYGVYALSGIPNYKFFTEYEYYIQADYVFTYTGTTTEQQNSVNAGLTTLGIVTKIDNSTYKYTLKSHVRKCALTPPTTNKKGSLRARVSNNVTEIYPAFTEKISSAQGGNPVISLKTDSSTIHVPTVSSGNVFAGKTKIQTSSGTKHLAKQSSDVDIKDSGIAWQSYGEQYRKYTQSYQEAVPSSYQNGTYHYTQPSQEYRYNYYGYNTVSNKRYAQGRDSYQYYNTDKSYAGNYNTTLTNSYYVIDSYKLTGYTFTYDGEYSFNYNYVTRTDQHETKHYKITGYNTIVDSYRTNTNYKYYAYSYVSGSHVSSYFYYNQVAHYSTAYYGYQYVAYYSYTNKEAYYRWNYIRYSYEVGYYYDHTAYQTATNTLGIFPVKSYRYRTAVTQYSYRIYYYNGWPLYVFQNYAIPQLRVYTGYYQVGPVYNPTFYNSSTNYSNVLSYNYNQGYEVYGTAYRYGYKTTDNYIAGYTADQVTNMEYGYNEAYRYISSYTADRGTNYALDYGTKYDKTMISGYTQVPDRVHYTTNYAYDYSTYSYTQTYGTATARAYNGVVSHPTYAVDRTHRVDVYRQDVRQLTGYTYYYYWDNTYFYTQPQYYIQNATAYKYYNNPVPNYSYRYSGYRYNSAYPTRYSQYYRYLNVREF